VVKQFQDYLLITKKQSKLLEKPQKHIALVLVSGDKPA
jgi:hypothetical protein